MRRKTQLAQLLGLAAIVQVLSALWVPSDGQVIPDYLDADLFATDHRRVPPTPAKDATGWRR